MSRKEKTLKALESGKSGKSLKNTFEDALIPFAIVALIAGSVMGAVKKGTELIALYYENPALYGLLVAVAFALVALAGLKFYSANINPAWLAWIRTGTLTAIGLIYLATLTYASWCIWLHLCRVAPWHPVFYPFFADHAFAAEQIKPNDLVIQDVAIDRTRSSFTMKKDDQSIHAMPESAIRTSVEFDRRLIGVFENASCRTLDGEQPIEDALPIWRDLLKKRNEPILAARLADYNAYRTLIKTGGEAIFKAIPTASELAKLKKDNASNFNIIMRWLSNCIGLADPVLIWTVKNNSDRDLLLVDVAYDVLDVGQVKGAGPTPVEPIDVETHDLAHNVGVQTQPLEPRVSMPPKSIASIRIRYRLEAYKPGLSWLVRAIFRASDGTKATSDEFKIFGAKRPSVPN